MILRSEHKEHVGGQCLHVLGPLHQRRQIDLNDIQTIVQVFPETVLPDRLFQIRVRGGKDPDIRLSRPRITYPLVFTIL